MPWLRNNAQVVGNTSDDDSPFALTFAMTDGASLVLTATAAGAANMAGIARLRS